MAFSEILFGDEAVFFPTEFSLETSVRRLSGRVEPFRFLSGLRAHEGVRVFGSVSSQRVRLVWVTPFVSNIFRPRFVGHFEARGDRAVLVGKFAAVPVAKLWACAIAAIGLLGVVVMAMQQQPPGRPILVLALPIACAITFAGFAAIRLSQWLTRGVRRKLAAFITVSLGERAAAPYG